MRRFLLALLLLLLGLVTPRAVFAQQPGWLIENFDSNIRIEQSGKVNVTETIDVDFVSLAKHGIYRDIPYVYDDGGDKIYTELQVLNVERDGYKEKFETSKSKSYLRLKIGRADSTISGKHTYVINYLVTGVIASFPNFDELYWNATGNYWDVMIAKVSVNVILPKSSIQSIACYQGQRQASDQCLNSGSKSSVAFKSTRMLLPNEGMTVAVGFDKNTVPILTVAPPIPFETRLLSPIPIFIFVTVTALLWYAILMLWWNKGRDFWLRRKDLFDPSAKEEKRPLGNHETVVVEYSPPQNLRPAQLGIIIDQQADTRDVTATIIDLATRGFIKIHEVEKTWVFGSTDYELTSLKKEGGLLDYEKELLDRLFETGETVKISSLKRKFYKDLVKVKDKLYEDVVANKFFIKRPDTVRSLYLFLAIALLSLGVGVGIFAIGKENPYLAAFGGAVFLGSIPLLPLAPFMPRRTGQGRELYRRTKGFYLFIDKAEKHRQKFFEDKNLFNEVLPYAITFRLVQKFADAMKEIGVEPKTTTWYTGVHAFNMHTFGSNIDSFSNSVSHAISSAPRSSGSGGGGFSGGGFGGGGGGSW